MPTLMPGPVRVEAAGNKPELIEEVVLLRDRRLAFPPEPAHRDPG